MLWREVIIEAEVAATVVLIIMHYLIQKMHHRIGIGVARVEEVEVEVADQGIRIIIMLKTLQLRDPKLSQINIQVSMVMVVVVAKDL